MNFSTFYSDLITRIYVSRFVQNRDLVNTVREKLPDVEVFTCAGKEEIPEIHRNAKTVFISHQTGKMVDRCPGTKGHLCCNYLTVNLYVGCTIGCSYCIMRWYLHFEPIQVFADVTPAIDIVVRIAEANPEATIRVGTGEVGDSLLYDPLFDLSRPLIDVFAGYKNIYFELKTKTGFVDHLLDIPQKGNCVIAFSLNPQPLSEAEEPGAVSVKDRLDAARRAILAGYNAAFHFDPIIYSETWEEEYLPLAESLGTFPQDKIVWISLGTLRYPPELKDKIAERSYLFDEFVRSRDGKYRYIQVKRIGMYKKMVAALRRGGVRAPLYFCMESPAVWKSVFGALPDELPGLQPIFGPCVIP